jgi:hypothetical protein
MTPRHTAIKLGGGCEFCVFLGRGRGSYFVPSDLISLSTVSNGVNSTVLASGINCAGSNPNGSVNNGSFTVISDILYLQKLRC